MAGYLAADSAAVVVTSQAVQTEKVSLLLVALAVEEAEAVVRLVLAVQAVGQALVVVADPGAIFQPSRESRLVSEVAEPWQLFVPEEERL